MRPFNLVQSILLFSCPLSRALANRIDYGTVIGIDLGTTYSCVGIYQGGRVDIIPNEQGNRVTPSWVGFAEGERLIGDPAKQSFHTAPAQTVFDIKRLLGRRYDEPALHEDMRHWPFKVVNSNGNPAIRVVFEGKERTFTPQEISAMILGRLKETAEAYLGHPVTHAVVTVPAYFNDEQRQATKDAGQIAGLNVLRIINEPTAAAIAYGLDKKGDGASLTVVYDLGGGTFDVSLLRMSEGVFEVLATSGDGHLGGEDFDNRLIDYFVSRYQKEKTVDVSKNKRAMSKLKREVEKAKRTLSSQLTTRLEIESFEGGNDFSFVLTRAKFEELNIDLFKRTLEPVAAVLRDAKIGAQNIDDIVLVGGSTRIPRVRQLLKEYFGGIEPRMGINPDEAVAYGASIQGSILSGSTPSHDDIILIDICPFALGVATTGGVFSQLIARNTPIPTRKSEVFSTAANNQRTVLIQVFQGDHSSIKDNILLGTFTLAGIPPSARGVPRIEVIFEVDANGILTVVARDKDGGNSESLTITSEKSQLAKTDLARMVYEAQGFSERDQEFRECAAALNELQKLISNKRVDLENSNPADRMRVHALLSDHSDWADSLGSSATIAELNSRLSEVRQLSGDPKPPVAAASIPGVVEIHGESRAPSSNVLMNNAFHADL